MTTADKPELAPLLNESMANQSGDCLLERLEKACAQWHCNRMVLDLPGLAWQTRSCVSGTA